MQEIKFDNVLELKSATSKVSVSYLDVRNQVANCRLKSRGFEIKSKVPLMYVKVRNSKEAINKKFRDLKARGKVK